MMSLGPPGGNGTISLIGVSPASIVRKMFKQASLVRADSSWLLGTRPLKGLHRTSVVSLRGQVCRLPPYDSRGTKGDGASASARAKTLPYNAFSNHPNS